MRFARMTGLIDAVILAVIGAGWFHFVGWPVLVIVSGVGVLLYVHYRIRLAREVTDDEAMGVMAYAWSVGETGEHLCPLGLDERDMRGILLMLREKGLDIVRVKPLGVYEQNKVIDLNIENGPYRHYLSHPGYAEPPRAYAPEGPEDHGFSDPRWTTRPRFPVG